MGKGKVLERQLDKVDLTLDCIFAGDIDEDLLPYTIRSYRNNNGYTKESSKAWYRKIFQVSHPSDEIDIWESYRKGDKCDECGKKLHMLNKAYVGLCDMCNEIIQMSNTSPFTMHEYAIQMHESIIL